MTAPDAVAADRDRASVAATRSRVLGTALVFVVLVACASRAFLAHAWHHVPLEAYRLLYSAATLGFNYPDFGFVRRGLGGTLIHYSGLAQLAGTAAFHVASAALLAAVALRFVQRMHATTQERVVHLAVFAVALLFWAEDVGRTDMAVAAMAGLVALAVRAGRPLLAVLLLLVALAVHEDGVIFGAPLAAVLALDAHRKGRISGAALARAGAVLLCGLAAYLFLDRLPHADNATVAAAVRSRLPRDELVDWALYYGLAGMRGVRTSMCQNCVVDPNYALHVASGLFVIALATAILVGSEPRLRRDALLASLPPYLFLCLVANDLARWAMLAVMNVWFVSASRPAAERAPQRASFAAPLLAVALLLVATHPRRPFAIANTIFSPSPLLEAASIRLGGPATPDLGIVLPRCDPTWRDVLDTRTR